jgi:hypothetical protein
VPPPPASTERPAGRSRRRGLVAGAIALAVALVAGSLVLVLGRGGSAEARPLALRFVAGESRTYELHQTMDGRVAADLFGEQAMTMEMTQVSTWDVVSVDAEGVATIEVTVTEFSGSMNGIEMPDSASSVPPIEFRVAPDGRILSAGGFALGGAAQTDGFGFPGMGQLTPILPDDGQAVAPGDTWEKEYAQEFPFGEGTIAFTSTNAYERNEEVNGREAAVIVSDVSVPLDFTIELDRMLEALGGEMPAGATGLDAVADATLAYAGGGEFSMTSWVDLEAKELLKSESAGDFDIEMRFEGLAGFEGAMTFAGTFSQDLEVREG